MSTEPRIQDVPASELREGDLVDLASCPHLQGHPSAEFEYARVGGVVRESASCVRVDYEGIDSVGYPPDLRLRRVDE